MDKVLVDSDILIDYFRTSKGLLPDLISFQIGGKIEIYISSVTVFELFAGSSSKKDKVKIQELIEKLKVIVFDGKLAQFAGELTRDNKLSVPLADFIIASSALYIDALIATRNKEHFRPIPGIKFFDF